MVFSSFQYLFLFLPIVFVVFQFCAKINSSLCIYWIILSSFVFYISWSIYYLPLLILSILFNYVVGNELSRCVYFKKIMFIFALIVNVSVLVYFKYTNFIIYNINSFFEYSIPNGNIILPLAISFFTFQQIAWLFDKYYNSAPRCSFAEYSCAVAYFPHLIAGPIVKYVDLIPQLQNEKSFRFVWKNIAKGIFLISLGLFKKIVIADTLSEYVSPGFADPASLHLIFAWCVALGYCVQIYFDFSGYCDMAMGASIFFNIELPENFRTPYASKTISEFWRRWHITLGAFFLRCLYIPLGGSQGTLIRTCCNLFLVMSISGLWHGAGYGFILWGCLHGAALVIHKIWRLKLFRFFLPPWLAWLSTFLFVTLAWVPFRADSLESSFAMYQSLVGLHGVVLPVFLQPFLGALLPSETFAELWTYGFIVPAQRTFWFVLLFAIFWSVRGLEPSAIWRKMTECEQSHLIVYGVFFVGAALFWGAVIKMTLIPYSEFIYFNF